MGEIIDMQKYRMKKAWRRVEKSFGGPLRVQSTSLSFEQQQELAKSMSRHPAGRSRHE